MDDVLFTVHCVQHIEKINFAVLLPGIVIISFLTSLFQFLVVMTVMIGNYWNNVIRQIAVFRNTAI